jgi:mannose-1-phosphate guanylyltransferase/mannose-6-phosphate isomerase
VARQRAIAASTFRVGIVMKPIIPVILSGGAGSRLWPLSTKTKPKQFHVLHGANTMFADTFARVSPGQALNFGPAMIVCGVDHCDPVKCELDNAKAVGATLILEPMPRNTAPALAAAALLQLERDPDALMLVLPADHVILHPDRLHQACADAREIAQSGKIVTFAIEPESPETGYGYIKRGLELAPGVFTVESFREKPDLATAQSYLDDGSFAWNAGIFYFRASALIDELGQHAPEILAFVREAVAKGARENNVLALDPLSFGQAPSISFDYAVMEPTSHGAVVPVSMGWSDVGSFATLWELGAKDENGNVARGRVELFDSADCYVNSHEVPVALIGVTDLVVISTPQGILITKRDRAQDVRLAAEALKG